MRVAAAMRLARRRLAENAAIRNLAVAVDVASRRAARIAGPNRQQYVTLPPLTVRYLLADQTLVRICSLEHYR